jgi:hypothetical protein
MTELSELIKAGKITASTLVWKPGMDNWQAVAEVSELSGLIAPQTPPPLPNS